MFLLKISGILRIYSGWWVQESYPVGHTNRQEVFKVGNKIFNTASIEVTLMSLLYYNIWTKFYMLDLKSQK